MIGYLGFEGKTKQKEIIHSLASVEYRPKMLLCSICYRIFERLDDLHNHMQAIHQNRYKCETCGRSFPTRALCGNHKTTHVHERFELFLRLRREKKPKD